MGARNIVCPNCKAENLPDARFCEMCGSKLVAAAPSAASAVSAAVATRPEAAGQKKPPSPPVGETTTLPLYTVMVKESDDAIRALGEKSKVALFGLVGKRTLMGPKPEDYVVLESMVWTDRVYVRIHGVYSSTYAIDSMFALNASDDTIEVEVAGAAKLVPERGTLRLPVKLRKVLRKETTTCYDELAEEVQTQLPPKSELKPVRTVHPPLTLERVQVLLDTAMGWAGKDLKANIAKLLASGAKVEKEDLDLSDHEVVLAPYCVLTYLNPKTSEKKGLTFDSLTGKILPSAVAQRQR